MDCKLCRLFKKRLQFFQSLSRHRPVHSSFRFFHCSHPHLFYSLLVIINESPDRILSKEGNNTKELFDAFSLVPLSFRISSDISQKVV